MNESQIFANALKLATPEERAAYLGRACAGDDKLIQADWRLAESPRHRPWVP